MYAWQKGKYNGCRIVNFYFLSKMTETSALSPLKPEQSRHFFTLPTPLLVRVKTQNSDCILSVKICT